MITLTKHGNLLIIDGLSDTPDFVTQNNSGFAKNRDNEYIIYQEVPQRGLFQIGDYTNVVGMVDDAALYDFLKEFFAGSLGEISGSVSLKDENGDPIEQTNPLPISIHDSVTGDPAEVNTRGQLKVVLDGRVCDMNSTSTPLGAGSTFTGTGIDILDYAIISINVFSDQASAIDGLKVQQSSDGTNWDLEDVFSIPVNIGKTFSFQTAAKFFRIVYVNGSVAQTVFRLQVVLKKTNTKSSSHRIQDSIIDDDDATLQKSVLTGKDVVSDDFVNVGTKVGAIGNNILVSVDQVETTTNSLQVIGYDHAELHDGSSFHFGVIDDDLDNGEELIIAFRTPNTTKWAHLILDVNNTSGSLLEFMESPTITVDSGIQSPIFNRNRNSSTISGIQSIETVPVSGQMTINPIITIDGIVLQPDLISAGKEKLQGGNRGENEWLLKQDTIYAVRLTGTADNGKANINLNWYEHTNK